MNKLNLLLLLIICTSCLPDEAKFEGFRRGDVQRLLSQGDQKIWLLEERVLMGEAVELDNCENARQLIFNFTSSATDSDSLWYVNYNKECNAQNDTLKGIWYIPLLNNAFAATDTVVFVWDSVDTAFFHLSTISPIELSLESISPNDSLTESFVADKEYEGLRVHELEKLLSSGIQKKWTLQRRIVDGETLALDTCEVDRQLIFNYTSNTSDNNSLWYVNKAATCATETDTLKGYWFIPSPGSSLLPTDTVAFVWESASPEFFEVNTIAQGQLEIESLSSGTDLVERFGN